MKRYILSILATVAVVVISVAPIPEVPQLENIPFFDKWMHFVMYGGLCSVYWFDYFRTKHNSSDYMKWIVWIVAFPILLGGLLELVQKYLTSTRNGDWLDFFANSVGVFLAIPLGLFIVKYIAKK